MNARLTALQTRLTAFWAARNGRERIILGLGAAVIVTAAYVLASDVLQRRIAGLQRKLPDLLLASYEIAGGARGATPATRSGDLRSELFKLLADRGLKAELRALSPDQVEMRLPDQDAKSLIANLNAIRLASASRVLSLQLRATGTAGEAGATAVLERRR